MHALGKFVLTASKDFSVAVSHISNEVGGAGLAGWLLVVPNI